MPLTMQIFLCVITKVPCTLTNKLQTFLGPAPMQSHPNDLYKSKNLQRTTQKKHVFMQTVNHTVAIKVFLFDYQYNKKIFQLIILQNICKLKFYLSLPFLKENALNKKNHKQEN